MDEIRTTAEARAEARRRLRMARNLLEQARKDAREAEEVLYGHAPRSWRATRRIEDATEAVCERIGELAAPAPDQADEPVDLSDAPFRDCRQCGKPADPRGEDIGLCWDCGHALPEADQADEPVDLASPPGA